MALPDSGYAPVPAGYEVVGTVSGRKKVTVTGMTVRIQGLRAVQDGLKAMQVTDAPFLRAALMDIGGALAVAMTAAAPFPSFKTGSPRITGRGANLKVTVPSVHPGARSREFGRKWYFRGFKGRAMKTGVKFVATPGQIARPYLGIVSGPSVAESIRPLAEPLLLKAYEDEWKRASAAQSGDEYEV